MRNRLLSFLLFSILSFTLLGQPRVSPSSAFVAADMPAAAEHASQSEGLVICQLNWQHPPKLPSWKVIYASQPHLEARMDQMIPLLVENQQIQPKEGQQLVPIIFQTADRSHRSAEAWIKEGALCQSYGLMQTSIKLLEKAEDLQGTNSESFYQGLEVRKQAYIQSKNWAAVQRDLQSQLALASQQHSAYASQQGLLRLQLATVALLNQNDQKALSEFFWLRQHPETQVPLNWLNAWMLSAADAQLLAREATQLEACLPRTTFFWLRNIRAQALALSGHYPHAYPLFDTLFEKALTPEQRASALSQKGWAYFREGNMEQARQSLEKARDILPGQALSEFYLGMTLVQLQSEDEAIRAFKKALQHGLPHDEADHARQLNQVLELNSQYASLRPD